MTHSYLIDLHEDIAMYYFSGQGYGYQGDSFHLDIDGRHGDLPKYERGDVRLVFASVFPLLRTLEPQTSQQMSEGYDEPTPAFVAQSPMSVAIEMIKIYYQLQSQYDDRVTIIQRAEDLIEIQNGRKLGFLISLEGTEALSSPSDVKVLWKLGVRCTGLTWNLDTKFGSSCMSKPDYGLTGMGHSLVEDANELGMILDLAHAGKQTCLDVIEKSSLPVIISHANFAGIRATRRNVDSEVLTRLGRNGGVLGFTLIPSTIGEKSSLEGLVKHIVAVRNTFGPEVMAIGTDFFGLLFPDNPPAGLEDISKISTLWAALKNSGFEKSEIEALQHGNALRVLEANARKWKA